MKATRTALPPGWGRIAVFPNMSPDTSTYQAFKIWLGGYVPFDRDTLHFFVGLGLMLLVLLIARRRSLRARLVSAFLLALIAGLVMEMLDRRGDIAWLGYWRARASALDVLRTVAIPALCLMLHLVWPHIGGRKSMP